MRFVLGFILRCLCTVQVSASETKQPNILLLFADDLGYEKLDCYGGQNVAAQHLDAFTEPSLIFSRAPE